MIRWVPPSTTAASPRQRATWPGSGSCWWTTATHGGLGGLGGVRVSSPPEAAGPGVDPVVPAAWLAATRAPGPGVREAFAATENELVLPGGWYRNQFWVIPGTGGPVLVCLGIHGQLVYADRAARTVVVKLSSWPDPQHTGYLLDTLRACAALAAHLSVGV